MHAAISRIFTSSDDVAIAAAIAGAAFGAAPDVIGWLGRAFNRRWQWYTEFHHGWPARALCWIPAYGAHLAVDKLVHIGVGHWWPRFWYVELLTWLVGLGFLAPALLDIFF